MSMLSNAVSAFQFSKQKITAVAEKHFNKPTEKLQPDEFKPARKAYTDDDSDDDLRGKGLLDEYIFLLYLLFKKE